MCATVGNPDRWQQRNSVPASIFEVARSGFLSPLFMGADRASISHAPMPPIGPSIRRAALTQVSYNRPQVIGPQTAQDLRLAILYRALNNLQPFSRPNSIGMIEAKLFLKDDQGIRHHSRRFW
jgi:hypothetical protein